MTVIDDDLLEFFRQKARCEWCGSEQRSGLDPHHCFSRGAGRIDMAINLLALCRQCHVDAHAGNMTRADLLAVVAAREGLMQDEIERRIFEIRRS